MHVIIILLWARHTGMGGLFAPCLRDDIFVNMLYALKGYGEEPTIGCCEMPNRHAAATTTKKECDEMTSGR